MTLPLTVHVIEGRGTPDRILLQLHGFYANQFQISTLGPIVEPTGQYLVVSPRGPRPIGDWDAYWYVRDADGIDADSFVASLDAIEAVLDTECATRGFSRGDAVVAGFSQGASLALALAGRARDDDAPQVAGVIAWSGFLPHVTGLTYDANRLAGLPVLMQHGTHDVPIPLATAEAGATELRGFGADVTFHTYEMGHDVSVESLGDCRTWLANVTAGT